MASWRGWDFFRDGWRNIRRHKLRSALTLLGIVFGIAAVITMMGIGEGAQRTVLRDIAGLGLRNIIVDSVRPVHKQKQSSSSSSRHANRLDFGVTIRDKEQIQGAWPSARVTEAHLVSKPVYVRGREVTTRILGIKDDYLTLTKARRVSGRLFAPADYENSHAVAMVNSALVQNFPPGPVVGQKISVNQQHFEIVGICDIPAHEGEPHLFLVHGCSMSRFGMVQIRMQAGGMDYFRTEVGQLVVQAPTENDVEPLNALVQRTLEMNHDEQDYRVTVPLYMLRSKQQTQRILNMVLVAIACISLVVGGIGIMNIMLASVTERIPEIGIRRALGATRRDILFQFLAETTTLSVLGGVIGCILGVAAVPLASRVIGWEGVITLPSVVVALVVSVLIGMIFGIAPAANAARKDPGVALTHE